MMELSWETWDKVAWEAIDGVRECGRGDATPEPRGTIVGLFIKYCKDKVFYNVATDSYYIEEKYMKIIKNPTILMMKLILEELKNE